MQIYWLFKTIWSKKSPYYTPVSILHLRANLHHVCGLCTRASAGWKLLTLLTKFSIQARGALLMCLCRSSQLCAWNGGLQFFLLFLSAAEWESQHDSGIGGTRNSRVTWNKMMISFKSVCAWSTLSTLGVRARAFLHYKAARQGRSSTHMQTGWAFHYEMTILIM